MAAARVIPILALAVLVAACSSSDDGGQGPTTTTGGPIAAPTEWPTA